MVENGKTTSFTVANTQEPLARLKAALGKAQALPKAGAPMVALPLVVFGSLVVIGVEITLRRVHASRFGRRAEI